MRVTELLTAALLQASAVLSTPLDDRSAKGASKRPNHPIGPQHPTKPFAVSPARSKTCILTARGNGKDDSANILKNVKKCNNGGHVIFPKGQDFTIGTALDLTFLKHIDLGKDISTLPYFFANAM
jgi:galacturan 1,4-alpha-galacturonidase